jgi:capsule polysaccharide export protein KpsC/LpsZ
MTKLVENYENSQKHKLYIIISWGMKNSKNKAHNLEKHLNTFYTRFE